MCIYCIFSPGLGVEQNSGHGRVDAGGWTLEGGRWRVDAGGLGWLLCCLLGNLRGKCIDMIDVWI